MERQFCEVSKYLIFCAEVSKNLAGHKFENNFVGLSK